MDGKSKVIVRVLFRRKEDRSKSNRFLSLESVDASSTHMIARDQNHCPCKCSGNRVTRYCLDEEMIVDHHRGRDGGTVGADRGITRCRFHLQSSDRMRRVHSLESTEKKNNIVQAGFPLLFFPVVESLCFARSSSSLASTDSLRNVKEYNLEKRFASLDAIIFLKDGMECKLRS